MPRPSVREGYTEWLSGDSLHIYSHDGAARDVSVMEELGLRPLSTQEGDAPSASHTGLLVLRAGPRQCLSGGAVGMMGAGPVWSHPGINPLAQCRVSVIQGRRGRQLHTTKCKRFEASHESALRVSCAG